MPEAAYKGEVYDTEEMIYRVPRLHNAVNVMRRDVNMLKSDVTDNKGMLVFELGSQRLEVPATSEFSNQFWERVDRMIDLSIQHNLATV